MKVLTLLLLQISLTSGMPSLDMCANFIMETVANKMTLYTPGYTENKTYPNDSYCSCEVYTLISTGQPRSLNVTVLDLNLELCTANARFDYLDIQTAHQFQNQYQISTLCGTTLPLSRFVSLTDDSGNRYGRDNTLYSLEYMRLDFTTDGGIEAKGVKLLLESHRGLKVQCQGVSGDLTTTVPPTTTTTTVVYVEDVLHEEKEARRRSTTITASIIGTLAVLFAIGLAIGVFLLIRKQKAKNTPSNANGVRRQSDGKPIYKDPCQGMPSLPVPSSAVADVTDQYIYMKDGLTTPIYENPHLMGDQVVYVNEDMNVGAAGAGGRAGTEEVEYHGYIIPGSGPNGEASTTGWGGVDSSPLLKGLVMTENKQPIPEPKKQRSKPFAASALSKQASNDSMSSERPLISQNNSPELSQRRETPSAVIERATPNDMIYEPALLKPSALKNKAKASGGALLPLHLHSKPVSKCSNNPPAPLAQKPAVKVKPNLKNIVQGQIPPPPLPNKPTASGPRSPQGESYQVVNVETTIS